MKTFMNFFPLYFTLFQFVVPFKGWQILAFLLNNYGTFVFWIPICTIYMSNYNTSACNRHMLEKLKLAEAFFKLQIFFYHFKTASILVVPLLHQTVSVKKDIIENKVHI